MVHLQHRAVLPLALGASNLNPVIGGVFAPGYLFLVAEFRSIISCPDQIIAANTLTNTLRKV